MLNVTNSNYINENIKSLGFDYFYRVGYGLSIGNVCSQNLAVFYLNEIDHFIKEELCCKYYIRYMDDGIILSKDKDYLRYIYNIIKIKLKNEYELELNNKTKLYKSSEGFTFIGFRYYIKNNKVYRRVRNSTRRSIKKRINIINKTNYNNYLKYEKFYKR